MQAPSDPAVPFVVLRGLALYLLSATTAAGALLAWPLPAVSTIVPLLLVAAVVALVAGEAASGLAAEAQRTWRARGRLLIAIAYSCLVALGAAIASAVPEPALLARAALLFAALQPPLLLVSGALADVRLALANALLLTALAALRGGPGAALIAWAAFVLMATFLLAENAARVLGAYAARRGPRLSTVAREGVTMIAPVAAGVALVLWAAPPRPWAAVRWSAGPPGELPRQVYAMVFLASLLGAGAVGLAAQLLRRRRQKAPPTEDIVEAIGTEEEPLPAPGEPPPAPMRGSRGRVVRAYLGFLRRAARQGRARRPDWTAREYERSLGSPAPVARLTLLFMDARYGPDDPSEAVVAEAERAAEQSVRALPAAKAPARAGAAR